jgi:hypothetical protein
LPGFAPHISQIELQQAVERYATLFIERATLEFEPLTLSSDHALADQALRLALRYASSALEVASGQQPEVNALDLLVFVVLTRASMEQYWLPELFGQRAEPLLKTLRKSEAELWSWAEGVLDDDKRAQLRALIERWVEAHPASPRVEWIRFAEFASVSADVERTRAVSGILSSVRAATRTADAALLLSERAMFLAQRVPPLLRAHARLGAREVLSDGMQRLGEVEQLVARAEALRPLVKELHTLTFSAERTISETRALTEQLQALARTAGPLLSVRTGIHGEPSTGAEQLLISAQGLSESAHETILRAHDLAKDAANIGTEGSARLEHLTRYLAAYAVLVGLAWTAIFCTGYYLTRRLADDRAAAKEHRT